jgi:hypothetical protein
MSLKEELRNHSPTILAGLGIGGFITAIIMSAKATPKAEDALDALNWKHNHPKSEFVDPPLKEKIKALVPVYAPTVGMAILSTGCIVGSNRMHRYRYASVLALYTIGERSLDRWQQATLETVGEKKYETIQERAGEPEKDPPSSMFMDDERTMFYDVFSGRYFRADSIESIRQIINDINKEMYEADFAPINDFYHRVGLPAMEYGEEWGWNIAYGSVYADFVPFLRNNRPVIRVEFKVKPRHY